MKNKDYIGRRLSYKNTAEDYQLIIETVENEKYDFSGDKPTSKEAKAYQVDLVKPDNDCLDIFDTFKEAEDFVKDFLKKVEFKSHIFPVEHYFSKDDKDNFDDRRQRLVNNNILLKVFYDNEDNQDVEKIMFFEKSDKTPLLEIRFEGPAPVVDFSLIDLFSGTDLDYVCEIKNIYSHAHMIKIYKEECYKKIR